MFSGPKGSILLYYVVEVVGNIPEVYFGIDNNFRYEQMWRNG